MEAEEDAGDGRGDRDGDDEEAEAGGVEDARAARGTLSPPAAAPAQPPQDIDVVFVASAAAEADASSRTGARSARLGGVCRELMTAAVCAARVGDAGENRVMSVAMRPPLAP